MPYERTENKENTEIANLSDFEKQIVSSIKSISIIEFKSESDEANTIANEDVKPKMWHVIDMALNKITQNKEESSETKKIAKRASIWANKKQRTAMSAFFGSVLGNEVQHHHRGKRDSSKLNNIIIFS